jgi:hypothetical protein
MKIKACKACVFASLQRSFLDIHTYIYAYTQTAVRGSLPLWLYNWDLLTYMHTQTHITVVKVSGPLWQENGGLHTYMHTYIHTHNSSKSFGAPVAKQLRLAYVYVYTHTHNSSASFGALVTKQLRLTYMHTHTHTHTTVVKALGASWQRSSNKFMSLCTRRHVWGWVRVLCEWQIMLRWRPCWRRCVCTKLWIWYKIHVKACDHCAKNRWCYNECLAGEGAYVWPLTDITCM